MNWSGKLFVIFFVNRRQKNCFEENVRKFSWEIVVISEISRWRSKSSFEEKAEIGSRCNEIWSGKVCGERNSVLEVNKSLIGSWPKESFSSFKFSFNEKFSVEQRQIVDSLDAACNLFRCFNLSESADEFQEEDYSWIITQFIKYFVRITEFFSTNVLSLITKRFLFSLSWHRK